eukprot:11638201-Alexandrium_andersonii.AAC.1
MSLLAAVFAFKAARDSSTASATSCRVLCGFKGPKHNCMRCISGRRKGGHGVTTQAQQITNSILLCLSCAQ